MKELLENELFETTVLLIFMLIVLQITNIVFNKIIQKKTKKIGISFFRGIIQAVIVIIFLIQIGGVFDLDSKTFERIMQSSSLIVILLGFILQESLSNIVHGMLLVTFKPFEIGSRIKLVNMNITGMVTNINLNNTMIKNLATSAILVIPNSVMAKEIIENFHYDEEMVHKYYFDIQISYSSDIDLAIKLIKQVVAKYSLDMRTDEEKANNIDQVDVLVQGLDIYGARLRCAVFTEDISSNFKACSNIRLEIVKAFKKHGIYISTNQAVVPPKAKVEENCNTDLKSAEKKEEKEGEEEQQ